MPFANQLEIMVVDDTTVSRTLIKEGLHEIGVQNVRIAKDGQEALKALMTKPAHLVVSDYHMPNLDGLGLLKALREYKPTSKLGFILVTGRGDQTLVDRGKQLGMNNFLTKPFTIPGLKTCLEAVTGKLV